MVTQSIILNQLYTAAHPQVRAVQGDTGRQLEMIIADRTLESGATGALSFERSDKTFYQVSAALSQVNNSFIANITQALTQPGVTKCQLKVTESSKIVSSYTFEILVEKNTTGEASSQDYYTITQALETAEEANETANEAVTTANNLVSELQDDIEEAQGYIDSFSDLQDTLDGKAELDGHYDGFTAGAADQIVGDKYTEDDEPYIFRKSGGSAEVIGNREINDAIVGATVAWNQMVSIPSNSISATTNGVTLTDNRDGTYNVITESGGATAQANISLQILFTMLANHVVFVLGMPANGSIDTYFLYSPEIGGVGPSGRIIKKTTDKNSGISIIVKSGIVISSAVKFTPMVFDLTQMFGSTIADYIYSLETAHAGDGVAWCKEHFPEAFNEYQPYDAGSLKSVEGLVSHDTVGFNQWDEEWESGEIKYGVPTSNAGCIRSKNFMPCIPNATYYLCCKSATTQYFIRPMFYDSNMVYIESGAWRSNLEFTVPNNCAYFKITSQNTGSEASTYGRTYKNDICINLSDPQRNGQYEPYQNHSYALDPDITLRGRISLDANNKLVYDGDIWKPNGKIRRKYGIVDLGTLTWTRSASATSGYYRFVGTLTTPAKGVPSSTIGNIICSKYTTLTGDMVYTTHDGISISTAGDAIVIYDTAYAQDTSANFKTAVTGIKAVYELATPTEEDATPFAYTQVVDKYGTEEYVTTGIVPVGHHTMYLEDLKDKLENLPNLAEEDGEYIIEQSNGVMALKPLEQVVVGTASQLMSNKGLTDTVSYTYRAIPHDSTREVMKKIVGATVGWNQLVDYAVVGPTGGTIIKQDNIIEYTLTSITENIYTNGVGAQSSPAVVGHKYFMSAEITLPHTPSASRFNLYIGGQYKYFTPQANVKTRCETIANPTVVNSAQVHFAPYVNDGYVVGDKCYIENWMVFDLTAMLGTAIADYVYGLETATAGAGVEWLKSHFPKAFNKYQPYDAGSLKSVEGLVSHDTVGFNQWDEEWENKGINVSTGQTENDNTKISSKNYIKIDQNKTYYCKSTYTAIYPFYYDANFNYLGYDVNGIANTVFTPFANASYIRFRVGNFAKPITTYNHDICINLSDPQRNGQYEPYQKHSYPLDPEQTLRGIFKLDSANNLYADGDEWYADGRKNVRYGIVDLGSLNWVRLLASGSVYVFYAEGIAKAKNYNFLCSEYKNSETTRYTMPDKSCGVTNDNKDTFCIRDDAYTDKNTFKTAMNGVYLVYELATPTESTAPAFADTQIVDPDGTEEFVTDCIVSPGHETFYPDNLVGKLDAIPALPTANGNYRLQATVSNGKVTYAWVTA